MTPNDTFTATVNGKTQKPGMRYWFPKFFLKIVPVFGIYKKNWKLDLAALYDYKYFKPSKGLNVIVLIILAWDIEMNPGPR